MIVCFEWSHKSFRKWPIEIDQQKASIDQIGLCADQSSTNRRSIEVEND